MSDPLDCCGELFPDLDRLAHNRPLAGRVFTVLAESQGVGVSGRRVEVDRAGWARCAACPRYRPCYDLSLARLLLRLALKESA